VDNARKYERSAISQDGNALDQFEVLVFGESVRLVDFSAGGLYVISKLPFSPGEIDISVSFRKSGKIDLIGSRMNACVHGSLPRPEVARAGVCGKRLLHLTMRPTMDLDSFP